MLFMATKFVTISLRLNCLRLSRWPRWFQLRITSARRTGTARRGSKRTLYGQTATKSQMSIKCALAVLAQFPQRI